MTNTNGPLISVAMTVFNAAPFLAKSIESLLAQDHGNFELIISDNASEDGSSEICRKYASLDKRIQYYRNAVNMGPARSSFKAVDLCSGEFIMIAADHDVYHPSFMSSLLDLLLKDESVVLAYPHTILIDEKDQPLEVMPDVLDTRGMEACQRFSKIIWEIGLGNMVYGLFRMAPFRKVWRSHPTIGPDLVIAAELSLIGSIAQIEEPFFIRRRNRPVEDTQKMVRRQADLYLTHNYSALVPWTMLAYEHGKVIRESDLSAQEKDLLLADIRNCFPKKFGRTMRNEAVELLNNSEQVVFGSNHPPSVQLDKYLELAEIVEVIRYYYPNMPELARFDSFRSRLYPSRQQPASSAIEPYYRSSARTKASYPPDAPAFEIDGRRAHADPTNMKYPNALVEQYGKAQDHITAGNIEEALIELEKLLERHPDFAIAYNDLGVIYYNKGDKERAQNCYEKAVALEPNNSNFQKNLADYYYIELGRAEDAIKIYLKVLAAHPDDIEALIAIGNYCVSAERFDEAMFFCNRVLKIDQTNTEALKIVEFLKDHQGVSRTSARVDAVTNGVECPICGGRFRTFMPFGVKPRPNALCPTCHSLERHRLLWLYLQRKTRFFSEPLKVLDIAPAECLTRKLADLPNIDYLSIDLNSHLAMQHMDITSLSFLDNQFDCIFCYHVLEHIPDDNKAISELFRVLKPSGWAIMQVPINEDLERTLEDPTVTGPEEREKRFGQNDHVRKYGRDYKERLEKGRFFVTVDAFVTELPSDQARTYALDQKENIYVCRKNV